jgi:hypothetical protein
MGARRVWSRTVAKPSEAGAPGAEGHNSREWGAKSGGLLRNLGE